MNPAASRSREARGGRGCCCCCRSCRAGRLPAVYTSTTAAAKAMMKSAGWRSEAPGGGKATPRPRPTRSDGRSLLLLMLLARMMQLLMRDSVSRSDRRHLHVYSSTNLHSILDSIAPTATC